MIARRTFDDTHSERMTVSRIRTKMTVTCDQASDAAVAAALEEAEVAILRGDLDDRFEKAPRLSWIHCDHAGPHRQALAVGPRHAT